MHHFLISLCKRCVVPGACGFKSNAKMYANHSGSVAEVAQHSALLKVRYGHCTTTRWLAHSLPPLSIILCTLCYSTLLLLTELQDVTR